MLPRGGDATQALALGDVDLALVAGRCFGDPAEPCSDVATWVLINRHRQLTVPTWPARCGSQQLELRSQPGYARGAQIALPALAPAVTFAPVRLPGLVTVVLDPGASVALPWVAIVAAPSRLDVRVPVDRERSGASVVCQALVLDLAPGGAPRLTGPGFGRVLN